jgi:YgiT-type zinc finger domain-containing protein
LFSKCYFCGGEIDPRRATAENWWGDSLALVQNVPALVCRNCGEVYFEADVCRKLDKLRAAPPSALKNRLSAFGSRLSARAFSSFLGGRRGDHGWLL